MVATVHFSPVTTTAYMNCKVPLLELVMGTEGTASIKTTRELGMSLIFLIFLKNFCVPHLANYLYFFRKSKIDSRRVHYYLHCWSSWCRRLHNVLFTDLDNFGTSLIIKLTQIKKNTKVIFPLLLVSEIDRIFSHLETIISFSIHNDV